MSISRGNPTVLPAYVWGLDLSGDANGLGLRSSTYTANSLNQYTQRTVPDTFDVLGSAQSNATVTVNNLSAYRKADYFWKELTITNSSAAVYQPVSVVGVKNNVGTAGSRNSETTFSRNSETTPCLTPRKATRAIPSSKRTPKGANVDAALPLRGARTP